MATEPIRESLSDLPEPPPEAVAMFNEARRKRASLGIPGHVDLRCDEAANQPPAWSVWLGGMLYGRVRVAPKK
jgi:hypothetical protein